MDTNLFQNKTTEKLENEILATDDIDAFRDENVDEFIKIELSDYLKQLLEKYNTDKSSIFARANMLESNYGYEIFKGNKKNVSRDKLIQICFGFPLNPEETKTVLRLGGVRPLYARDERDAFIMFALKNGMTIQKTDEMLYEHGMKTIMA